MIDDVLLMDIIHEDTEKRTIIDIGVRYPDGTIDWDPKWPGNFTTMVPPLDIKQNRERFLRSHRQAYEALRILEPYVAPSFVYREIRISFGEISDYMSELDPQE